MVPKMHPRVDAVSGDADNGVVFRSEEGVEKGSGARLGAASVNGTRHVGAHFLCCLDGCAEGRGGIDLHRLGTCRGENGRSFVVAACNRNASVRAAVSEMRMCW